MDLPRRKNMRLAGYDYASCGAYFITICAQNRECLFGGVGADSISARLIQRTFLETIDTYPNIACSNYVIMPNHFHAIIIISQTDNPQTGEERADMESTGCDPAPTISSVIQTFKRYSTVEYIKMVKQFILPPFNKRLWQRSFYDRIIRSEQEYQKISQYIDENPLKWTEDCFYQPI